MNGILYSALTISQPNPTSNYPHEDIPLGHE